MIVPLKHPSMSYTTSKSSSDDECSYYLSNTASLSLSTTLPSTATSTRSFASSPLPSLSSTTSEEIKQEVECGKSQVCFDMHRCGFYTGQADVKTGLPHGLGTLRFEDGMISQGEWKTGCLIESQEDPLVSQNSCQRLIDTGPHNMSQCINKHGSKVLGGKNTDRNKRKANSAPQSAAKLLGCSSTISNASIETRSLFPSEFNSQHNCCKKYVRFDIPNQIFTIPLEEDDVLPSSFGFNG